MFFGCRCWSCVCWCCFAYVFCFMFWRFAPEDAWKNSLDVRSFRRLVPAFSSVRFRIRPFFSPLSSLFFLLSSLGVGPGSSSPLLCVCPQDADASDRQVGAAHAAFSILSFLVFSLCPGRLPSPSLLLLSLSLSLSFSLSLSLACMQSVTVNSLDCNEASSWIQSRAVLCNLQLIERRGRNKVSGGDSADVPFRVLSVCSVGNADGNRSVIHS